MLIKLDEIEQLIRKDQKLGNIINQIGDLEIKLDENYFNSLANSIIGQQLSMKAASTIINRFNTLCGEITPNNILNLSDESIREVGVSRPKISYIKDLAQKVSKNVIDLEHIAELSDEAIIQNLTKVKGIGEWTAQMFLIFTLGRKDVLPDKDLGIKKAIKLLYQLEDLPDTIKIHEIGSIWEPYRSVASLYLWRALDRKII
ncbi:MAG: HhH-GPD family protein [Haloplasmataceae bacterium]|jgi:DNA-3-methyladenine glycosylase II|nr:HhH-GPD family protein [Haloplasmataceae bacterium]